MTGEGGMTVDSASFALPAALGIPLIVAVAFSKDPDMSEDDAIMLSSSLDVPTPTLAFRATKGEGGNIWQIS
jgi:hypothetical protein